MAVESQNLYLQGGEQRGRERGDGGHDRRAIGKLLARAAVGHCGRQ